MISHLEEFFKNTPLGIKSILQGAVHLAEKVNSRTDISGKEKSELVVKTLVEFLGEGNPELVALVEGVIPGVLDLIVSTARGKYILNEVTSAATTASSCVSCVSSTTRLTLSTDCLGCLPCLGKPAPKPKEVTATPPAAEPAASAAPAAVTQDPINEVSARKSSVWAWVRSPFFRPVSSQTTPVNPVIPTEASLVTTIREPGATA